MQTTSYEKVDNETHTYDTQQVTVMTRRRQLVGVCLLQNGGLNNVSGNIAQWLCNYTW